MNPLQRYVAADALLPAQTRRAYAAAECMADADTVAKALDQLAVRLTVRYQASMPMLVSLGPDAMFVCSALLQRVVFPCRVVTWSADTAPAALDVPVVLIAEDDDADTRRRAQDAWRAAGAPECLTVALLEGDGVDLAALALTLPSGRRWLGCGYSVAGYGHNLPELYAFPHSAQNIGQNNEEPLK